MNRYCLDTSAYSRFHGGDEAVAALLDAADWVGVPAVVLGEILLGLRIGRRAEAGLGELERFLEHPLVAIVDLDRDTASLWAELIEELRAAGTPVPTNDVWVAAAAIRTGSAVLTCDQHFRSIGVRAVLPGE